MQPAQSIAPTGYEARLLSDMLGESIGAERATEAVAEALAALGYDSLLTREQALTVLERISTHPGIVGIAARFVKSRVHLHWKAPEKSTDRGPMNKGTMNKGTMDKGTMGKGTMGKGTMGG